MKKKSQVFIQNSTNYQVFQKVLVLFNTCHLLRVTSVFVIITLMLMIPLQKARKSQQANQTTSKVNTKINPTINNTKQKISTKVLSKIPSQKQQLVYNIKQKPQLKNSQELQKIVDQVVKIASSKNLPTTDLSITLIDLKSDEQASFQQQQPRYPASIVKLYWLVMLQAQIEQNDLTYNEQLDLDLKKMIKDSDNEAASRILDLITDTESGAELNNLELKNWINKREATNRFFINAGYENINISQKTFPIPYLKLYSPQGRELQIRKDINKPIRNKITTQATSQLMYEIANRQAISPKKSEDIFNLLSTNTETRNKKKYDTNTNTFNSVRGFLSQSLPDDIYFAAKAGWTSELRGETAYIATKDRQVEYILTVVAENPSYAQNWDIFPQMSTYIFNQMKTRNNIQDKTANL